MGRLMAGSGAPPSGRSTGHRSSARHQPSSLKGALIAQRPARPCPMRSGPARFRGQARVFRYSVMTVGALMPHSGSRKRQRVARCAAVRGCDRSTVAHAECLAVLRGVCSYQVRNWLTTLAHHQRRSAASIRAAATTVLARQNETGLIAAASQLEEVAPRRSSAEGRAMSCFSPPCGLAKPVGQSS